MEAWRIRKASLLFPEPFTADGKLRPEVMNAAMIYERGDCRVIRAGGTNPKLDIFWTGACGWGVRSLQPLDEGEFVCLYEGELRTDEEAESRCSADPKQHRDAYLFNLTTAAQCRELGASVPEAATDCCEDWDNEPFFVIDAFGSQSHGRFLNHACGPSHQANVLALFAFVDCGGDIIPDARVPLVALFANRRIEEGEELRYDYHLRPAEDGEPLSCLCGSAVCRGRVK